MRLCKKALPFFLILFFIVVTGFCQSNGGIKWKKDGNSYFEYSEGNIMEISLVDNKGTVVVSSEKLVPAGLHKPLDIRGYFFSDDYHQILISTNTKKVWRYETRGDYWVYNMQTGSLIQLGKTLPASSLMFAKISPDGTKVAYVSRNNLFVEDLATSTIKQLTFDGARKLINGTFDWAYEEEFDCRDGFRWSPDSKQIAFWQIDAKNTRDYLMLNTTDSIYPKAIPVEYPVAGEAPSPYKIGVVDILTARTKWMDIPTDPVLGSYVPRMEWAANNTQLIIQHLNRRQNQSDLILCDVATGSSAVIYTEKDPAWIDILPSWDGKYKTGGWDWLKEGKEFLWAGDKDGWRHLYRISKDGKKETLITTGNYDVMKIDRVDEKGNYVYFTASPDNATQAYLYRTTLDGKGKPELLSPTNQRGTHDYNISPNAKFARHTFSNHYTPKALEWVALPDHSALFGRHMVYEAVKAADSSKSNMSFFKIKTGEGVEMDAWMVKPGKFRFFKKIPGCFLCVYRACGSKCPGCLPCRKQPALPGEYGA